MTRFTLLTAAAATAAVAMLSVAEARDGCGRGWYFDGRGCAPEGRYYAPRGYGAPGYYYRDPRPYVGVSPFTGRPTRDINEAAGCPRYWTLQDGVCKPYRGR